jgi:hypothetical protein
MKKWLLVFIGCILVMTSYAQQATGETIEMADAMRASGKIYVVVLVIMVILAGLFIYLIGLDRKMGKLEKEVDHLTGSSE